ncbi:MAG: phosphoribosylglycinamide formyltransferase [Candidatus Omnitrophica bacterium]|nr:phosphoribosylglycinamide formyltransferase [Candidatus Omnitrophota bacterium]MBU1128029.1 phosphoribosylglycinamide formyltransferase [Candidatus Omnitrophota bacterium]MBU1784527.1 phosphoribosylglycinamide formyltransferase [Candidatus Omnitrophota bacterium]MBU1851125.1 phosphoribosylglycinamide formyltransferase [Candidatus Omnitrophota bacterium]
MNIAVFVSGNGSNLQALIDAEKKGGLSSGKIKLVVCDKSDAFALVRAKKHNIPVFVLTGDRHASREEYDKVIIEELDQKNIGLIVLAGFMRILSGHFVNKYANRILNIHPALLPAFKGANGIKDAYDAGVDVTGVTVHFVIEELDSGPIIFQEEVKIGKNESLEKLEEKIHKVEHKLYPKAVRMFVDGEMRS